MNPALCIRFIKGSEAGSRVIRKKKQSWAGVRNGPWIYSRAKAGSMSRLYSFAGSASLRAARSSAGRRSGIRFTT